MPIEVQCSACGKRLKAPDEQAGRSGKCPSCKAEITIPARSAGVSAERSNAGAAAVTAVVGSSSSVDTLLLDAKNWFALSIGLRITDVALIIGCIACGLVSLALVAEKLKAGYALPDILTQQTIEVIGRWGQAALVLGWGALLAGWLTSLLSWPAVERRWLRNCIWAASISVVAMLICSSLRVFGFFDPPATTENSANVTIIPTAIVLVANLAAAVPLVLYNFFLAAVRQRMGREKTSRLPIVYAAVVGVLTAWCWIANLAIAPSTPLKSWLIVLSTVATFVTAFLWLWIINRSTSHELRVSQAWKRL